VTTTDLTEIRETIRVLALKDSDFLAGDAVVNQIALFKATIDSLRESGAPWLIDWLEAEHYKAAVLYTAAKVDWQYEQDGPRSIADRMMRARILARFNEWVAQIQNRLVHYQSSRQQRGVTSPWLEELRLFRADPVRNH
jgi:hypothetical protein